jgi:tripartite-type tricarboxylate transporter receptor subunit TctC
VGYSPGGGYDAYSRLLARHIGKYIPGNPAVIVQNRPGAGSKLAANYIYNRAKPDGLTFGIFSRDLYSAQLAKDPGVEYDWGKFSWLGSMNSETYTFQVRTDKGIRTVEDIRKRPGEVVVMATGKGSAAHVWARLMEETLGVEFKWVIGYGGSADMALAMERKEGDAMWGSYSSLITQRPHWVEDKFVTIVLVGGMKRHPDLPEVPALGELVSGEMNKQMVLLMDAGNVMGRPYAAPPGMPADRLKLLRQAFAQAMKDPDLLAEAKKAKRPIALVEGEEAAELAKGIVAASPETVAAFQELFK